MTSKPIALLLVVIAGFFLTSCASPTEELPFVTYTITVKPRDAHLQLVCGQEIVAEGDTVNGVVRLQARAKDSELLDVKTTTPGYRVRPFIHMRGQTSIEVELAPSS